MNDLSAMLTAQAEDQILISILYRRLYDPNFRGFNVPVEPWTAKEPDGWFHPSSQSLYTLRQLYLYLTRPDLLTAERMPLTGVLAVTAGTFWHRFIQMVLLDDGILVEGEVPVRDDYTHRRGHADGVLSNGEVLEIKSINDYQVEKINSGEVLREKKPQYWAQSQDYLDCLGLSKMRYLIIAPTYPFRMSEFVIQSDFDYIAKRRVEYRRAYELSLDYPDGSKADDLAFDTLPACCVPKSVQAKSCFAQLACPVGRFQG